MHQVRDTAIILRRKPFGEADLLLTLYGQQSGKVTVIAKGARRITSKLLGYTELFTIVSCQIDTRGSIPIMSQVSHEQLFDGIFDNPRLYDRLHIIAELIDKGTEEHEANLALYRCLVSGMEELIRNPAPLTFAHFVYRITNLLGFTPQLTVCAHCGEPIRPDDDLLWSEAHGGVVRCPSVGVSGTPLTLNELKVLRYIAKGTVQQVAKLSVSRDFAARIEGLLLRHAQYALDKDLVAARKTSERL